VGRQINARDVLKLGMRTDRSHLLVFLATNEQEGRVNIAAEYAERYKGRHGDKRTHGSVTVRLEEQPRHAPPRVRGAL